MTPAQLAELIDRQGAALVLFARQWCAAPEDVVQEAFLKLFTTTGKQTLHDPVAWLYRVVRNASLDMAKMERRRKLRESNRPAREWFVEPAGEGLDREQVQLALEKLPSEERETIVARLWGGLTFEQIAEVSGCSPSTVFRRYEAGIASLRLKLDAPCQQPIRSSTL